VSPTAQSAGAAVGSPKRSTSAVRASSRAARPEAVLGAVMRAPEPEPLLVIDREAEDANRAAMVERLKDVPNFHPGEDSRSFHGRAFHTPEGKEPVLPRVTWASKKKPRENSPDWLTATEYSEVPAVFEAKVKLLANLLRASRRTLAYTGAGLSVAAGIGMAAVGSSGQGGMAVGTAGEPTLSHCMLAELNRQRLLHGWVQQNHDGLPQKAGYRQEEINEVHGSWFDPSNPVVKHSGRLRGDLFDDMQNQADTADLVIVLGTSLTGLNADQCVHKTAERSREGLALGSVIISPQRTGQDGKCALRIFAKADDVMTALAREFGFGPGALGKRRGVSRSADLYPKEDKVLVPYDKDGVRSTTVKTWWDLSKGAKLRIGANNNIRGAKQPNDKDITEETVGSVIGRDEKSCSFTLAFAGTHKKLGLWWLETAKRGGLAALLLDVLKDEEWRVCLW